jgi:hypothetical protein
MLLKQGLVQLLPKRQPPKSSSRNPNAYCEFHQNSGHPTDRCRNLQHKIPDLIEEGRIAVTDEAPPIAPNPNEKVGVLKDLLPSHAPSASALFPFFPLALTAYYLR